jgi:insulysin
VQLPERTNWIVSHEVDLESQGNCAYLSYWEMGQGSEYFAAGEIIENLIGSKAFEELRTQQQLGYTVSFMHCFKKDVHYGNFIIQSDVQEPNYVHGRVIAFLDDMKKFMDELTQEEFEKTQTAVASTLQEPDESIQQKCTIHWFQVARQEYAWNYMDECVKMLQTATLADVKDTFNKMFFEQRKVLEFHVVNPMRRDESRKLREERASKDSTVKLAKNCKSFMRQMPLYQDNWSFEKE